MIQYNRGLKYLDLSWNGFALDGTKAIFRSLRINRTLEELSLKSNRIELKAIIGASNCWERNRKLRVLRLGLNPLTLMGIHQLLYGIEHNPECALKLLDIEGIPLNEKLIQMVQRISNIRPFEVFSGHCISWAAGANKHAKPDAMTFLMNYLNRHGIRVVDLYRLIDVNKSGLMSRADFIKGVLHKKIPLNAHDIQSVLDFIDHEETNRISFQMFSSRLFLYRVSVRDQIRIRASEFSSHQLDQKRLFAHSRGPKDLDKPPEGFPSRIKFNTPSVNSEQGSKRLDAQTQTPGTSNRDNTDTLTVAWKNNDDIKERKLTDKYTVLPSQLVKNQSSEDANLVIVPILNVFDDRYYSVD